MTLAALEATLRTYLNEDEARQKIPTLRMLTESADDVKKRATKLKTALSKKVDSKKITLEVVEEISRAGGGSLPMCDIPTFCVCATFKKGTAEEADKFLIQNCEPPIIARLTHDKLYFDARTLEEADFPIIAEGLENYFKQGK